MGAFWIDGESERVKGSNAALRVSKDSNVMSDVHCHAI